jgi:hypothetical protein
VISGFNTDVEFDDVVYHVQTEDKGLKSRLIVSLVYDRGTILASKRASYEDLADVAFDENELAERVQRQHKLICAAVRTGRLEDLKRFSANERSKPAKSTTAVVEAATPVAVVDLQKSVRYAQPDTAEEVLPEAVISEDVEIVEASAIFDAVAIVDDAAIISDAIPAPETFLASDAVEVVSELSGLERPTNNKLSLEVLGDAKFKGGDRRTVNIMVCRGTGRKVVSDAQIMVKVLGSAFRPLIFHAKTDKNGLAKVHLQLPNFQAGRAAVLIRAISASEEVELRRIITPN